jgi:hypothetical protein
MSVGHLLRDDAERVHSERLDPAVLRRPAGTTGSTSGQPAGESTSGLSNVTHNANDMVVVDRRPGAEPQQAGNATGQLFDVGVRPQKFAWSK